MANLVSKIKSDSIEARKEKQEGKDRLSTLCLLISELELRKIELLLNEVTDLTDEQVIEVVNTQLKKLSKEKEAYAAAGKSTLSQDKEAEVLMSYLPPQATEEEIADAIKKAVGLTEAGEIKNPMQYLSKELKGKADMKQVVELVKGLS